jgi:hypothetical protein
MVQQWRQRRGEGSAGRRRCWVLRGCGVHGSGRGADLQRRERKIEGQKRNETGRISANSLWKRGWEEGEVTIRGSIGVV